MLYQKILTEDQPYQLILSGLLSGFEEHRHADIEFNYCVSGSFEVIAEKKSYTVREGEVFLVASGVPHSFPPSNGNKRQVFTCVVGPGFLKKGFERFAKCGF